MTRAGGRYRAPLHLIYTIGKCIVILQVKQGKKMKSVAKTDDFYDNGKTRKKTKREKGVFL